MSTSQMLSQVRDGHLPVDFIIRAPEARLRRVIRDLCLKAPELHTVVSNVMQDVMMEETLTALDYRTPAVGADHPASTGAVGPHSPAADRSTHTPEPVPSSPTIAGLSSPATVSGSYSPIVAGFSSPTAAGPSRPKKQRRMTTSPTDARPFTALSTDGQQVEVDENCDCPSVWMVPSGKHVCYHHPGAVEVVYDHPIWRNKGEDFLGPMDTWDYRDMFPEGFRYKCCGADLTVRGCVLGPHLKRRD